jgi:hypothetical protein
VLFLRRAAELGKDIAETAAKPALAALCSTAGLLVEVLEKSKPPKSMLGSADRAPPG